MIPSKNGIIALLAVAPVAVLASFYEIALLLLSVITIVLLCLFVLEFVILKRMAGKLQADRNTARCWSLGTPTVVNLQLQNKSRLNCKLTCHDLYPAQFKCEQLPLSINLQPQQRSQLQYRIVPFERGDFSIPGVECRLSHWLWQYQFTLPVKTDILVYPNFAAQRQTGLLAGATTESQQGEIKHRQRGGGNEFNQLREFRDGDPLRTIDWKASSRLQKLIAKEFQDERDQQIIVLLDCGKRMAHSDGEFTHLDDTLNTVILLSHIASKQGDAVGLMTFGGIDRWVPPAKGPTASQRLLNQIYDLQPTREVPDFITAAHKLMQHVQKRALIIIVTNTRNDEQSALTESIALLRKRHLVLLADLNESVVTELMNQEINTEDNALSWLGASSYQLQRDNFHTRLRSSGALIVDSTPSRLTGNLISRYHQIKTMGKL